MPFRVTLLLPSLTAWQHGLAPGHSFPVLETLLSRAELLATGPHTPDQLRMLAFAYPLRDCEPVPVAAISYLSTVNGVIAARGAAEIQPAGNKRWFLRLDPVSMQADMSCVRLMHSGFGGYPQEYRLSVSETITGVLAQEGLEFQAVGGQCWVISLPEDPGVAFTALDDALGDDVSDCLPGGEKGRYWKRLLNEIQMALHANPDNRQRTERGERVINSVWPWGGGELPTARKPCVLDHVFSADPVSQGLARLNACELYGLDEWAGTPASGQVLLDWVVSEERLRLDPDRLEKICAALLAGLKQRPGELQIQTPQGGWLLHSRQLRYFWKRRKPLSWHLQRMNSQQHGSPVAQNI